MNSSSAKIIISKYHLANWTFNTKEMYDMGLNIFFSFFN